MKKIIVLLLVQLFSPTLIASPAALDAWQPWLRDRHPDTDCPRIATQLQQKRCGWPGVLQLDVGDSGGQFSQEWIVYGKSWLELPGDNEHWPLDVSVNGRPAAVLERGGRPVLLLAAGNYSIRGNFRWSELPQALTVPASNGLLQLSRNDKTIAQTTLDAEGRLWLKAPRQSAEANADDAIQVEVFRRIDDAIPRRVHTLLRLSVAGKPREIMLGRFLPMESELLGFTSPLPARVEDDGRLRVQARPGRWQIEADVRLLGDINSFRMERLDPAWPAQEIWSFAADQALRRAKVEGVVSVDPSQLDLPEAFRGLPTYLLEADGELKLQQQYRGDATPAANELALRKTLWLDFEGTGATVRDQISGSMVQGWRLEAQPALQLGRVKINGEPALITRTTQATNAGVEIRDANIQLDAVSRIDAVRTMPATGWNADFTGMNMSLRLPPGWKLWHVSGPDTVQSSWLSQWNLWNIFLALLVVGSIFRLLEWRWAALAALTVALVYHETGSPVLYLIPLLVILALLGVLGAGRLRSFLVRSGYVFSALLMVVLLAFAVEQIRIAIYPQLEITQAYPADAAQQQIETKVLEEVAVDAIEAPAAALYAPAPAIVSQARAKRYSADTNVQTGPGMPNWSWHAVELRWSGPVKADETMTLYVSGPWLTRLLKILEVLLATVLSLGILRALWRQRQPLAKTANFTGSAAAGLLLVAIGAGVLPAPGAQAEEFPPQYLLEELAARATKPLDCEPDCASVSAAEVRIVDDMLSIRLRVGLGGALAFPLPVVSDWQPRSVLVDGAPHKAVLRDGENLWLPLSAGYHEIVLEAPLASTDFTIQFALLPHHVSVGADDWDAFGIAADRLSSNTLQLQKRERGTQTDTLLQAPAKPFLQVERHLELDIDWTVTTTVTRVAPQQGAINASIPLLPTESVLTAGIDAKDGKVSVSLGSQEQQVSWRSVLKPAAQMTLQASTGSLWVEGWTVTAAPRWHVESAGLTPVKADRAGGAATRWQPWPGEQLTINAVQPLAVKGATTTVESVLVKMQPGQRSSDVTTTLVIDSSVGGDYHVQLAEEARLKAVAVNGVDISQSSAEEKVVVPLNPGNNSVELKWELSRGTALVTRTPKLALDTESSNITVDMQLPRDRWPLWVRGPDLGPVMLYWGVLLVMIGVAIGLGRAGRRWHLSIPLASWQWLLLGIGMSTVNAVGSVPVVLWFFVLEARRRMSAPDNYFRHNLAQVAIVLLSFWALASLAATIQSSLLALPDMQVMGNGSHNYFYRWYQDRIGPLLPQASVVSVPLWVYRLTMLAWSLWLAFALMQWIKWGWQIFAQAGLWIAKPKAAPTIQDAAPVDSPAVAAATDSRSE